MNGDGYYNWLFEDIDIGRVLVFTTYLTDTKDDRYRVLLSKL